MYKIKNSIFTIILTFIIMFCFFGMHSIYAVVDEAGIFTSADFLSISTDVARYANRGLNKLGYNITHYYDQVNNREQILSYIRNPGKNYAFFFFGHSDSSHITAKNGAAIGSISASDISGYWHLVVLAGCETGANTTFAQAFNVINGTNKAFLGFYRQISVGNCMEWNRLFWDYVGTMSLRECALAATEFTDVAGSVPVRMYGDKTWWGWAWNT